MTLLNLAIMGGHVDTLKSLLTMDDIGINRPDVYRNYPIVNAVMFRLSRSVIEMMVRRSDIDLEVTNVSGLTVKDFLSRHQLPQYADLF
jgi:hypothetical protein